MTAPPPDPPLIGGVVLLRGDGAAALQHRDEKPGLSAAGLWVFPGGHCEPDELPGDGARREFREETGYDCLHLRHLTEFSHLSPDTGRVFRLSFWWEHWDGVRALHCYEGQAMRFVPRPEADRLPLPDYLPGVWDLALAASDRSNSA